MINQDAVIHARRKNPDMLRHGEEEHPITVQLGGSDPARLARAAAVCDAEYRYDEINLNCGCPSAKVVAKPDASKCFGAVLMRDPELVGECLRRMREAVDVPVTIKHRLGVRSRERGSKKPRARDGDPPPRTTSTPSTRTPTSFASSTPSRTSPAWTTSSSTRGARSWAA